jgi:uncharacterized protein
MATTAEVQQRYQQALDLLIEKVQRDHWIIAAVLLGSLSYDVVWEKSDIDLLLIREEGKQKSGGCTLVEAGINVHVIMMPRSEFRKMMEGSLQSSFMHSAVVVRGRLLFTRDETIRSLFESRDRLGARDREIQLLRAGASILPALVKAEKWFHVKQDLDYSFFWIMRCLDGLATIEVLTHGEITGREVIQQALPHNPEFFRAVYTDLIHGEKTREVIHAALQRIHGYLRERVTDVFRPILDYLAEAQGIRSATELNHYFSNQMNLEGIDTACEWLADEEIIQKLSSPHRLTEKSRVDVQEAAYYYGGEPLE